MVETATRGEGKGSTNLPRHWTRGKEDIVNRTKNSFIALAGTLALVAIAAAFTPGTTQGQSGSTPSKDVTVVNTPNVNVVNSPMVSVANSPIVRAQQEGAWSVSLAGSPTVKVDDSAREPLTIDLGEMTEFTQGGYATAAFPVPEGKRFVVEHVYASAQPPSQNPGFVHFQIEFLTEDYSFYRRYPVSHTTQTYFNSDPPKAERFVVAPQQKLYLPNPAADGKSPGLRLTMYTPGSSWLSAPVAVSGYLEPLP